VLVDSISASIRAREAFATVFQVMGEGGLGLEGSRAAGTGEVRDRDRIKQLN